MKTSNPTIGDGITRPETPSTSFWERKTAEILGLAGIQINGRRSWDLRVRNIQFFPNLFAHHSMGLGDSYIEGWWDVPRLDEFFHRVLQARLDEKVRPTWELAWLRVKALLLNLQSGARAFEVGKKHYDLGNDLFQAMLGPHMAYTCGYWKEANDLPQAQEAKLELVCRKIGLRPGQRVLDVGGGWGSFAKFAAERYEARVTAITISKEQAELGRERCAGLPVEIRLQDYRNLKGERFDHIVSLGMFEHVGYKNYRSFMEIMDSCLDDQGLFLLHTIGGNDTQLETDPWLDRYIFPNSLIPSPRQITASLEKIFVIEDWHNFGPDYDKTLLAWFDNFDAHWDEIKDRYDGRFYRMWKYYLLQCAGIFRARKKQLWQIVLSKRGVPGGYEPVR
ncbi:MAG TPA: cyclopropane fatty acyl phospholipid synthase [bacterium]|nr:cyclopropane fatty acyl phospholipid synthase [bacterium]